MSASVSYFSSGRTLVFVLVAGIGGFLLGRSHPGAQPTRQAALAATTASAGPRTADAARMGPAPTTPLLERGWSDDAWKTMQAETSSPRRNASLAAMLEALAAEAPARALLLANAEPNRIFRRELLEHVLRGWAKTAPLDAARWALAADSDFRESALAAAFSGAVGADPGAALRAGRLLLQEPGASAAGCGNQLVVALCAAGQFAAATEFARTADAAPERNGLLGEAYARWASFQPAEAANAALALGDADRVAALRGVIGGWSAADPAAAVDFSTQLPLAPSDKAELEGQALLRWSKTDLKGASDWMNSHELGAAMDRGVAAIATQDYMKPDVAMSWAESVVDPALRSETLAAVLRRWATTDPVAAGHYLQSTTALQPDDRREIEGLLATLNGQSS